MADKILVLIDSAAGQVSPLSWECISLAQKLASDANLEVQALALGKLDTSSRARLSSLAIHSAVIVTGTNLESYSPEIYIEATNRLLSELSPEIVLIPHSYQNMDWVPRLAARLNLPLVTDCTGYKRQSGDLVFSRQMFRSKLNADIRLESPPPWLVTLQSGSASADDIEEGACQLIEKTIDLSDVAYQRNVLETVETSKGKVDLSKAEVIIGVGRGIKKQENLRLVEELAAVLKAELGASRPVVDSEWLERERQIGSSGQNVSPKLYIAVGISGAIQHVVGIRNSGCIVAINSDPHAPIFNIATYGVLGDLQEILPALTRKLSEL